MKARCAASASAGQTLITLAVLCTTALPSAWADAVSPPSSLVGWWAGDGTASDLAGSNHGVLYGVTFEPGMVGDGFRFNGVNDFVLVADSTSLRLTNEVTVELWFKADEWLWDTSYPLVDKRAWEGCNYGALFSQNWGIQLYYDDPSVSAGNQFEISSCFPLPTPGVFHHFAGSYRQVDASHLELKTYLDGQLAKTAILPGNLAKAAVNAPLTIGSERGGAADFFKGVIDEVCLYDRALASTEIETIFNAGSAGKIKPLLPPTIVAQPQSVLVTVGSTVSFNARVAGTVPLACQWSFNGQPLSGATSPTLVLSNVQPDQAGAYTLAVTNLAGSAASSDAVLSVLPVHSRASLIVPENLATVDSRSGSSVLRSAIRLQEVYGASQFATGPILIQALRFRPSAMWGTPFSDTISNLQINLSTTPIQPGGLSPVFANNVGANDRVVHQGALQLSSICGGPAQGPKEFDIVVPLTTPFLYNPSEGNLLVDFRNFSGSSVTYVDAGPASGTASRVFALGAGSTQATSSDNGADVLQIDYSAGEGVPPSILQQPQAQSVDLHGRAVFMVVATGSVPLSYQWRFNGDLLDGATNATLLLSNVLSSQAGNYSVALTNTFGSVISAEVALSVNTSPLLVVPVNLARTDGRGGSSVLRDSIRLQEVYRASQFSFGPIQIEALRFRASALYGRAFSQTISNLQINLSATPVQPGAMNTVFAMNTGANDTEVFHGSVQLSSAFTPATGPKDFDIVIPLTTPFAYDPAAGNLLVDFRNYSGSLVTYVDAGDAKGNASRAFALGGNSTNATSRDAGADVIQLIYTPGMPASPTIAQQPQSLTVSAGSDATFRVAAFGTAPMAYQWHFNGEAMATEASATLTLAAVQPSQAGSYFVVVSNALGSITSAVAILTVEQPTPTAPFIVLQPRDRTVGVGASAEFSVIATGSPPMSYQWYWNGQLLAGASGSTLELTNLQTSQAGTYLVSVRNDLTLVSSRGAVLNVENREGGTVVFINYAGTNRAYVFDVDTTTKLEGAAFLAQLYAGPTAENLMPVGAAVPFLTGDGAGLFHGGIRYISSVPAGGTASLQVRAWECAAGPTWEAVRTSGGKAGASEVFEVATGGGISPPALPVGFESFALTTGTPSPRLKLMFLRPIAKAAMIRNLQTDKRGKCRFVLDGQAGANYRVELSSDLHAWRPLTNVFSSTGADSVEDPDARSTPQRFYRVQSIE